MGMGRSPFANKCADSVHIPFQVLRCVGMQLVEEGMAIAVSGLLQNGLEDLTLHVFRHLPV